MPALHVRFRPKTNPPSELFNDELTALCGMDLDDLLSSHNMRALVSFSDGMEDYSGISHEEWQASLEYIPPQYQKPWSETDDPYFPCDEGIAWCDKLTSILNSDPTSMQSKLINYRFILETLPTFRTLLEQGKAQGSNFQMVMVE